ncbi:hypothetical protein PoB_003920600 [Plakobranchus ocellatus]|uniref:Uncharacterized protein n=1 Tax=Plakobranchus ocellatus TaxID=259542 RepID=A0AAV4ANG0_9GAST|nr:hypothetical protein PoB_003920600 [Plakobranchus ocellatus]
MRFGHGPIQHLTAREFKLCFQHNPPGDNNCQVSVKFLSVTTSAAVREMMLCVGDIGTDKAVVELAADVFTSGEISLLSCISTCIPQQATSVSLGPSGTWTG